MSLEAIHSYKMLQEKTSANPKTYLLLYKAGTEKSEAALHNLQIAADKASASPLILYADVNKVRDIHTHYELKTVPSLLEFEGDAYKNVIKGVQSPEFYQTMLQDAAFFMQAQENGKQFKNVTVYSTTTCPWCNVLKDYLRKNRVPFQDLDISRDPQAAEELQRKSGQQGVPQTDIEGEIVVGFDQKRLNELLEI